MAEIIAGAGGRGCTGARVRAGGAAFAFICTIMAKDFTELVAWQLADVLLARSGLVQEAARLLERAAADEATRAQAQALLAELRRPN